MRQQNSPARGAWLRRGILMALILTAAALTLQTAKDPQPVPQTTPLPTTAPADERTRREAAYEADLTALQALVDKGDENIRMQAAQQLARMTQEHQQELGLEEAIAQAGLPVRAVLVQNGAITVIVPSGTLTQQTSAIMLSLCAAHTDAALENIRIMEAED